MRAKLSQFGGLSAHKNEETFAQIGLSPVNFVVDARYVTRSTVDDCTCLELARCPCPTPAVTRSG